MRLKNLTQRLDGIQSLTIQGRVLKAVGLTVEGTGPLPSVGQSCRILNEIGEPVVDAEVVGFRGDRVLLMPLGEMRGIGAGHRIAFDSRPVQVAVSPFYLGRVLDGLGRLIDQGEDIPCTESYPLHVGPPNPLDRERISKPLDLGVRGINALLTCGIGQKIGLFSGSGVGKSVLLGMICRHTSADVNVIALIGERGREVKEFIERELGTEGMKRSVVVAATSDQPPMVRLRGAFIATAIAEYFRDQGKQVLLLMDSLTRLAQAQREIGLAVGEPPTAKGYPPSVFTLLPKVLERVGPFGGGSVTGLYTVLVEGDDMTDPVADSVRAILDGHIVLSRHLAMQGHFPAIDVLQSTSRVMSEVTSTEQMMTARSLLEVMATYQNSEELINLGAYHPGANPRLDLAIQMREPIKNFLRQEQDVRAPLAESLQELQELSHRMRSMEQAQIKGTL